MQIATITFTSDLPQSLSRWNIYETRVEEEFGILTTLAAVDKLNLTLSVNFQLTSSKTIHLTRSSHTFAFYGLLKNFIVFIDIDDEREST